MIINEPDYIVDAVQRKLKHLERKVELSYSSAKNDNEKKMQVGKDLMDIKNALGKLQHRTLSWKDLQRFGITQSRLYAEADTDSENIKKEFSNFGLLSAIPKLRITESQDHEFVNELFSIMEYLNDNYQTIFAQKILLTSSKTNTIRERFYIMYQEISRMFKNYHQLVSNSISNRSNELLLEKEEHIILHKIVALLELMQQYLSLIQDDPTFSREDFLHVVVSMDDKSSINNLTLQTAFDECKHYIEEALDYIETKKLSEKK
ncbi:MAG: hypothetical protein ACRCS8_01850 [Brevinema sp.]